jgi:translation initiation factor 1
MDLRKLLDDKLDDNKGGNDAQICIKVIKRNKKKCVTTVSGLHKINENNVFLNNMTKYLKNEFHCNGSFNKKDLIITLQGDHRDDVKKYLIDKEYAQENDIVIRGAL